MKLLHIVPLVSPSAEYGGPVRGTLRQSAASMEKGHEVTVLSLWPRRSEVPVPDKVLGVSVKLFRVQVRLPGHGFVSLWSTAALLWLLRHVRDFDLVHIHGGREIWVHIAARIVQLHGVPYIWQSHGMIAPRVRTLVRIVDRFLTERSLKAAKAVLFLTRREQKDFQSQFSLTNLRLLINGVDHVASNDEVPIFTQGTPLRIVATSRLHRRKRIPELIDAVAVCRARGASVALTFFGHDEGDLSRAREAIERNGAESFVFYGGPLAYESVRAELRLHHILALPSVEEPFPNSVLEGMASGLVPLISSSCGLSPYIAAADAGVIVAGDDRESLESAVFTLAASADLYRRLQVNSLTLTRDVFEIHVISAELEKIYVQCKSEV